jgi:hypothetical protein
MGLRLVTRHGEEWRLIRLAAVAERLAPWPVTTAVGH